MVKSEREKLMDEYVQKFFTTFRILEVTGFCRFIIRNGKIVERNTISVLYNIFIAIMADIGALIILWSANMSEQTISPVEFGTVIHFTIFSNVLLFHITFGDKYRGPDLMQNCIEIDHFLGSEETQFMRSLIIKIYIILVILIGFTQIGLVCYMSYVFKVSFAIDVVGTTYFLWIFFVYDDFCFFLFSCFFLATRVRYLNVALLKITNMDIEHIPKQLFNYLLWDDKNDNRISFHTRAQSKDFSIVFRMLFHQLRHVERCYRFPITLGVFTIIMGSFATVQTFIMNIQASTAMTRASVITGWVIASWCYILVVSLIADMFYEQIEQTKLICAYTQLKCSSTANILKLTKDVIAALEIRDARMSLYNVSFFDTGLVFKLAASTFVYITVQLQLAFPNLDDGHKIENITKPATFQLDRNAVKEFLFLY